MRYSSLYLRKLINTRRAYPYGNRLPRVFCIKLPEEQREAWLEERGYSAEDFEAGVLEDEDLSLLSDEEREEYSKRFEREGTIEKNDKDTENLFGREAVEFELKGIDKS